LTLDEIVDLFAYLETSKNAGSPDARASASEGAP
jgi:hypothetical protein